MQLDLNEIDHLISLAISEDIKTGDITTLATINDDSTIKANFVAREALIFVGKPILKQIFSDKYTNGKVNLICNFDCGSHFEEGEVIATVTGDTKVILELERTALNFIQHLSAIATNTKRFVDEVAHTKAKILDTRKTIPGYRNLAKYAVKCGGGYNHRFGLYDGVLIKDNHIAASTSITDAVKKAKAYSPHFKIEVEVDTIIQLEEALDAKADIILLDNMNTRALRQAVALNNSKALLEASGGINIHNVKEVAETGVDYISIGALTHSVKAIDIGLDFE